MIFVTHDRYFLDVIATRIIEIDQGRAFSHPGNYTAFLESKAVRRQIAEQTERRRQRFLREELEWVRSGVKARGTKSRHRMEQYYEIEGMEAPPEEREMDLLIPPPPDLGQHRRRTRKRRRQRRHRSTRRAGCSATSRSPCGPASAPASSAATAWARPPCSSSASARSPPTEGTAVIGKRVKVNYIDQTRMRSTAPARC